MTNTLQAPDKKLVQKLLLNVTETRGHLSAKVGGSEGPSFGLQEAQGSRGTLRRGKAN